MEISFISDADNANSPVLILQTNTYDLIGNVLTQRDGNGNIATYRYNAFKKINTAVLPEDASISANTLTYQYDVMGNLKKISDSNSTVKIYSYDNEGRVLDTTLQNQMVPRRY